MKNVMWLGPWELTGVAGSRKLKRFSEPDAQGFRAGVEYLWEDTDRVSFAVKLNTIRRTWPGTLEPPAAPYPEHLEPKRTEKTEYFVRANDTGLIDWSLDTAADAVKMVMALKSFVVEGEHDPGWEAFSRTTTTTIEETIL